MHRKTGREKENVTSEFGQTNKTKYFQMRERRAMAECDLDGRRASLIRLALSLGDMSAGGLVAGGGPWPFHSDSSRAVPSPSPAVTPLRLPPCQGVNAMATASAEHRAVATGAGTVPRRLPYCVNTHTIPCVCTRTHAPFHQLNYRRRASASISSLNALKYSSVHTCSKVQVTQLKSN